MFARFLFALVAGLLFVGQAAAQTLTFSAIPDEDETRLQQRFNRVAGYLQERLGVEVRYLPMKSYPAVVTAFRNNQVQLAWFGGLSGVQARLAVPGSQALAQGEEDAAFVSYFVAHAGTGADAAADRLPEAMAGHSFTFGAKTSTSGRLMPEFYLRERFGKAPEAVFSRVGFSGDHSQTLVLVQSGAYDFGAVNYTAYEAAVKDGKIDPAVVRVIWKTPPYPDYNWTIRGDADQGFGAGFTAKVRAALLGMNDPKLLEAFPRQRFIPASNTDYAPVEATAKALGLID